MALFVVLEDHISAGVTFPAGKIIDDELYDRPALIAAGAALVAYVPATMDSILAPFRASRRSAPAAPTTLTGKFAAAGLFSVPGGAVSSVFGRGGAVVAVAGDYAASEVTDDSGVGGADVAASLDILAAAIPSVPVDSVFGRTGVVAAAASDYDASQIDNDSTVEGTTVADALVNARVTGLVTGLIEGGAISAGAGVGEFNIAAGVACFVDDISAASPLPGSPENPLATRVAFGPFTNQTITDIGTTAFTSIGISAAGAIVQEGDREFTSKEHRTICILGEAAHADNTNIAAFVNKPSPVNQIALGVTDIMAALGTINKTGNVYSANGANLTLDCSAGVSLRGGANHQNDPQDPNIITNAAASPVATGFSLFRNGTGGFTPGFEAAGLMDPGFYDTGTGSLVAVSPAGRFTIVPLWRVPSGQFVFHYGQALYNSLDLAQEAITDAVINSPDLDDSNFRGWLIVRGNATDLSDAAQARFVVAPKFSGGGTGAAGVITVHGDLSSLGVDDHTQYLLADGTRALTGNLATSGTFDGRAVATDGTKLDGIEAAADVIDATNVAAATAVMDGDFAGTYAGEMTRTGSAAYAVVKHNITATTDPGVGDDSDDDYGVKSVWINVTLDTAWVCVDATVGAAVWLQIGAGGGGALPDSTYVSSLNSSNFLTAPGIAGGVAAGGENDFIVLLWVRLEMGASSSNQIAAAVGGWEARWNFGGLRFVCIDSAGTAFGPSNLGSNTAYGSSIANSEGRDALIIMRVVGGAGTPSMTLEINGAEVADATAANAGTPQTATSIMEIGGSNDTSNLEGMGYVSGTLTDAQLTVIREDSFAAGGLRDTAGVLTNLWNSETAPAAGEWVDQAGTDDLTETGTVTSVTKRQKLA